jgi:putative ABC transport system permease protein
VSDTSYVLQGSLWVDAQTWRDVQTASRPDAAVSDGVFQILLVDASDGVAAEVLTGRIDEATAGATASLTKEEAVLSLPGTSEQQGVFNALIGATIFVAGLVTALFFALITIERTSLLATLKAIGAGSGRLLGGLVTQAVVMTTGAFLLGSLVTLGLAQVIPDTVPVRFEPSRGLVAGALLIITAAVGSALSLRRIVRIDPASAIG